MENKKGDLYLFLSFLERNGEMIGKIWQKACPQLIALGTQVCDPLKLDTTSLLGRGQVAEQD